MKEKENENLSNPASRNIVRAIRRYDKDQDEMKS